MAFQIAFQMNFQTNFQMTFQVSSFKFEKRRAGVKRTFHPKFKLYSETALSCNRFKFIF